MNDNQNNYNDQSRENAEKEEIRFSESDFDNPYSRYYSNETKQNSRGDDRGCDWNPYTSDSDNPYSKGYGAQRKSGGFSSELSDEAKHRSHFSRIGTGYALFSVITLAVSLIISFTVRYLNPEFYESALFMNMLTPVSLYLFALPVLLIVLSGCDTGVPEKRRMGFGEWLLFLIASFGAMYIGSIIGNNVMAFLSELVGYDYGNALNEIIDDENLWVTTIFAVIIAPIGEEFVFRKLIIDRTKKYGPLLSIGLSGLMFGLMHSNFYQFFYCFALGIILGYIYYTTGRLYLTIAIHAIINFVGGVVTTLLIPISDKLLSIDPEDPSALIEIVTESPLATLGFVVFELFVYAAMICAVVFPIAFRKKLMGKLYCGEIIIPRGRMIQTVILSGGIILMFVVYLLEFGLNLLPI